MKIVEGFRLRPLGKEFTAETLRDLLLERYDVSEEIAARDAENIARTWVEAGIAEE